MNYEVDQHMQEFCNTTFVHTYIDSHSVFKKDSLLIKKYVEKRRQLRQWIQVIFFSLQTPLTLEHSYFQAKENVPMETIETDSNNITKKNTQIRIHPPSMKGKNRNRSSTKDDINSGSASNNKMLRPRSHSTKNISKAKIKTIKLTMAVILGYIICSAPFCLAQIWSVFINPNIGKCFCLLYLKKHS